jgi:lysophospholipase L1-like esterase
MTRLHHLLRGVGLGLAVVVAVGCGGGSSSSTSATSQTAVDFDFGTNNPRKVTAFGDSITQGVLELRRRDLGLTTAGNYPALLQGRLRTLDASWVVANRGRGGEESGQGVRRLVGVLALDKPGFVLIMEGTNDATDCLSATAIATNLRGMVQIAKANRSIPIIGTIPPNFRNDPCAQNVVNQVNGHIRTVAELEDVVLAEIFEGMNDRSLFGQGPGRDPLHPNDRGYAVMADIWAQAMARAIPGGVPTALRRRR